MGIAITVKNADYSANAVYLPLPTIDFDFLSTEVGDVVYNPTTHELLVETVNSATNFEFAQTTEAISAKITVPVGNSVPLHALCIGGDASGNAIVAYLDNSGNIKKFDKNGIVGDIVDLYTIPSGRPNIGKGNEVTITHGETAVTIAYSGYSYDLLYSNVPTLTVKCMGVLAYGLGTSDYTFERVL